MNQTIKSAVMALAAVSAFGVFAAPAPGQETAFVNGEVVTNAENTVQYKKFGKIMAKEAVVVDLTSNVMAKGINTFIDEDPGFGEELLPKDNIYGVMLEHKSTDPATAGLINSYLLLTTTGFQYWSRTGVGDGCTYTGFTSAGNMNNSFWQYGTNLIEKASTFANCPKLQLPTNAVLPSKTIMLKQDGYDRFVSLADVVKIVQAQAAGKLTVTADSITIAE